MIELPSLGGLRVEEIAEVLKVSPITLMRDWTTDKGSESRILMAAFSTRAHIWRFHLTH